MVIKMKSQKLINKLKVKSIFPAMSIFIYEHALSKVTLMYKGKEVVEEFYQFASSLSS